MAISYCYWHLVVKNDNFTLLLTSSSQEWHLADLPADLPPSPSTDIYWSRIAISHCYWHLVVKNGNFTLLWHLVVNNGNFTLLLTSSDQEWQFHIATAISWSRMAISHCYWHLVVKNGNFTLLLTSSSQEWQLADLPADLPLSPALTSTDQE